MTTQTAIVVCVAIVGFVVLGVFCPDTALVVALFALFAFVFYNL